MSVPGETTLVVLYSQIVLSRGSIERPFSDWSKAAAAQGFSWREGSCSYATLGNDGDCRVRVQYRESAGGRRGALLTVRVPFRVPVGEELQIESVGSDVMRLAVDEALTHVIYSTGIDARGLWCLFELHGAGETTAAVLYHADHPDGYRADIVLDGQEA